MLSLTKFKNLKYKNIDILFINYIFLNFSQYVKKITLSYSIINIQVNLKNIEKFLFYLNKSSFFRFKILGEFTCTDNINIISKSNRFTISYILLSLILNKRIIISTQIDENTSINSISYLYKSADWLEREVYDMFGIFIKNHKNLRRILTDYGTDYFPLKKDFPVMGYEELIFNKYTKTLMYKEIDFISNFRNFEM